MFAASSAHRVSLRRAPSLLATLRNWVAISRQRRDLACLDEAALRDIGLSPRDAAAEAARPFWDAPQTWHR
jgi:uncharacterized protein YjiS (DUF1127 family)